MSARSFRYVDLIESGEVRQSLVKPELTAADRQAEAVFLGLRMMHGFSV